MGETVKGLEAWERRLATFPDELKDVVRRQLEENAETLVQAMRRRAPVSVLEASQGELRDSIRWYRNPKRDLSVRIIADAKDAKGNAIGKHVEHGHKAKDGSHVPAQPFFFPVYRGYKKPMKAKLSRVARALIKKRLAVKPLG